MRALILFLFMTPASSNAEGDAINISDYLGPVKSKDLTHGELIRLYDEAKKKCGGRTFPSSGGVMSCEDGRKIDIFNGAQVIDLNRPLVKKDEVITPELAPVVEKKGTTSANEKKTKGQNSGPITDKKKKKEPEKKEPAEKLSVEIRPNLKKEELSHCDDALTKEIEKFLTNDRNSILELQFHLTSLKMATRVVQEKNKNIRSVEDMARKLSKKINDEDKDKLRQKMVELYRREGLGEDSAFLEKNLELFKKANAWKKQDRLYNENMSALITLDMAVNDKSNFNETDAAITWLAGTAQKKIIKNFGLGSAQSNLSNLSYWVQLYSGAANRNLVDEALINAKTKKIEEALHGAFQSVAQSLKSQLKECFVNDQFKGEGPCWKEGTKVIDSEINKFIFKMSRDIKSSSAYAEDIKLGLKGRPVKGSTFSSLFAH